MFSVTANFKMAEVEAYIKAQVEAYFQSRIEQFKSIGKQFVDKARAKTKSEGGFGNISWNLRSSIGYLLLYNGQVVNIYFPTVGGGSEGSKTGEDYAREIALLVNQHEAIQLIIVAGMEYATFVERLGGVGGEGRDVITHVVGDNLGDALRTFLQ